MKTVREWFYTLPPKIRNRALEEAVKIQCHDLQRMSPSLEDALRGAFVWSATREGGDYWSRIASGQDKIDKRWSILGKVAFAAAVIMIVFMAASIQGCITVRQSGAHDITVNTNGNQNTFTAHTERANSAQSAEAEPKLSAVGDEALKTVGKTAAAVASGGMSTIPQAAAKIADDAKPVSGEPK